MSDIFKYYLKKYIEGFTNLESHLLCLQDKYNLFQGIEDIELHLYPYKVLPVENNVVFRTLYENIKEKSGQYYILLFDGKKDANKLLDFISRSEGNSIHQLSMQQLMETVEENLKWNERINEFNGMEIKKKFNDIIYYGKSLRKNNVDRNDIDKIVLSSILDLDGTRIMDEGDCYLYFRDIIEIYGDLEKLQDKYSIDIKGLLLRTFDEYSIILSNVIRDNYFESFDKLLWVTSVLSDYGKLSLGNLKIVLGKGYNEVQAYESHLERLVELVSIIGKKDKKHYIKKKDWAEKLILEVEIDILSDEHSYQEMIRENRGSLISVVKSIQESLRNYNLEGYKKVYTTNIKDLYELQELIEKSNHYKTKNIIELTALYGKIIELINKVEYLEAEIKKTHHISSYKDWQEFYKNHLYDLQYRLSEIKVLDQEQLVENQRYQKLDERISNLLNKYRERFALLLEKNYANWISSDYGISRPILNSDIEEFIPHNKGKNFVLVFDGMRYDAWDYIVRPYFERVLNGRNVKEKSSFSLLPSITSISREAIYSKIIKKYNKDTSYLTKSESVKNENEIKEILLEDKKYNIFVFNMFDKDGHRATEDFYIFYDKQRRVFENTITDLLKLLPEDANIIITSDHGLMRIDNYHNLREIEGISTIKSRYLKGNSKLALDKCINISDGKGLGDNQKFLLSYSNDGYFVGGGERDFYSHGGASIEEVIVPFILAESVKIKEHDLKGYKRDNQSVDVENIIILEDGVSLNVGFELKEKERLILTTLYALKNQTVTTQDIEKKLVKELGSAGMVNSLINRLIKKLNKEDLDIIEATSAGDVIVYKFKHNKLKGVK